MIHARLPAKEGAVNLTLECEQEVDGRWLAEVPQLPGVIVYGDSANDAMFKAQILALRVLAERLEHKEALPVSINISVPQLA
jgi:predicted RNase H-like HicB family nuclease